MGSMPSNLRVFASRPLRVGRNVRCRIDDEERDRKNKPTMQFLNRVFPFHVATLAIVFGGIPSTYAQQETAGTSVSLPDEPGQQQNAPPATQPQSQPATQPQPPQDTAGGQQQDPSSAKKPQSQQDQAEQQLKQEEHQRILGVVPNFNTTYNQNAAPLSAGQKFRLAFRSSVDPFTFVAAAADAGISQAEDDFPEYGQGAAGYGKRFGASYADSFDGNLWGNAIFPALLHEDPRYYRRGTGTFMRRLLYATSTTVWTRNDDGTWGPNYANVAGNIVAGGISNLYYPQSDRGVGLTFERAFTVTAEGALGAIGVEFWPDISRKVLHGRGSGMASTAPSPNSGH
jgi:hypothetical protein